MKIPEVIPLYKSGEKMFLQITGQYLYYHTSKQFWRNYIITYSICFCNKCNSLSPSPYGFRSSMSTTEALTHFVEAITTSLENNKHAVEVCIDLNEAFDVVDHDILCTKMVCVCVVSHRNGYRVI